MPGFLANVFFFWVGAHVILGLYTIGLTGFLSGTPAACGPDVAKWMCNTPLEALAEESRSRPDFNVTDEADDPGLLDTVTGGIAAVGGFVSLLWRAAVTVVNVIQFDYAILYDSGFLGTFPALLRMLGWLFSVLAFAGFIALARGRT